MWENLSKEEKVIDNGGYSHHELAPYLKSLGVDTLICGRIGSHGVDAVASNGLNLNPGAAGDVKEVVKVYLNGSLMTNYNSVHCCVHEGHHH